MLQQRIFKAHRCADDTVNDHAGAVAPKLPLVRSRSTRSMTDTIELLDVEASVLESRENTYMCAWCARTRTHGTHAKDAGQGKQPRELKLALKCDILESGFRAENVKWQSSSFIVYLCVIYVNGNDRRMTSDEFCRFFYVVEDTKFAQRVF